MISGTSFGQLQLADEKQINTDAIDEYIQAKMDSMQIPGLSMAIIDNTKVIYHHALGVKNLTSLEKVSNGLTKHTNKWRQTHLE